MLNGFNNYESRGLFQAPSWNCPESAKKALKNCGKTADASA
jgi:hypothetical protein